MVKIWEPKASQGETGPFLVRFHYVILCAMILVSGWIAFGMEADGLTVEGQRVLAIFVLCSSLWVTGLIPLQITSILAIVLLPMLEIMPSSEAFALFGNKAVFFILGAFILSAALIDCGLSVRLTCLALDRFTSSPKALRNAILYTCAFASFWMSEHGVAAMAFPIVLGLVKSFELVPGKSRFAQSFFFALAWGCVIGGIATYLGGARNPLAAGILFEETGIEISFVRLFSASIPIVILMLIAATIILNRMFPEEPVDMDRARALLNNEREKIGPLSRREIQVGLVSLLTILAWIFLHHRFGLATIALFAVAVLFMCRLVNWKEIETNVNWGIILMYGGAIALGSALHSTGASQWIIQNTLGGNQLSPYQLIIIMGILSLILTELISNAAVVSVMMPIGLGLAQVHGLSPEAATLAIALPSGLSYVMPMGTPATAIAYSSGYMSQKEFLKYGLIMHAFSILSFALVSWLYWPMIGIN